MGSNRRLGAALAASLLGSVLALATPAVAAATGYQYECSVFPDNMHAYLDVAGISNVYSHFADIAYLRPALPCTVGDGGSLVLPVNIQGSGAGCAAQLGWGSVNSSNSQYWWITTNDNSCDLTVPSGWPTPVTGHSYHLTINQTGPTQWQYVMHDNNTGLSYYAYGSRHTNGSEVWSGFEVHYREDVMGGAGAAQYIYDIGYKTSSGGSAIYLTTTTVHKGACSSSDCTWMSYWHAGATHDSDGHSEIYAYTDAH